MSLDPDFLRLLVCPSTRQPLRLATPAELAATNARISAGAVRNRGGQLVSAPLAAGLVPARDPFVYPIQDGIPILLTGEAIPLDSAGAAAGPNG